MARTRTSRTPFYTSMVSIALVLFFLGLFGLVALAGKVLVDVAKEKIELRAVLLEGTEEDKGRAITGELGQQPWVKDIAFRTKEENFQAAQALDKDGFYDAMGGINPFPSSVNIYLKYDYIQADSVQAITEHILRYPEVQEVNYPLALIENVNQNVGVLRWVSFGIGAMLIFVAYLLIVNTIRLAIFSKRLVIRSMQLIGATRGFIIKPFIRMGLVQGFFGGLIALIFLTAILVGLFYQERVIGINLLPYVDELLNSLELKVLYLLLLIFGSLLGWFSSRRAVNKFLDRNLDQLV